MLWKTVNGSDRPPPDGDPDRAPEETSGEPSLVDRIEQAGGEVDELEGRFMAMVAGVENRVMGELRKQSADMGVGRSGFAFLKTKQGRVLAVTMLTLILTSFGQIVGALRGAPSPAPAAAPTVFYVPAPLASAK